MNPGIVSSGQSSITMPLGLLGRSIPCPTPYNISGVDQDAYRYLEAVERADRVSIEPSIRIAITNFVIGCKNDGIWDKLLQCGLLMGARTLSGALVQLVGNPVTNQNFVTTDYNRKTGLLGNSVNKNLLTSLAGDAMPQNDIHLSFFATSTHPDSTERFYIIGGFATGSNTHIATTRTRLRDGNAGFAGNNTIGFVGGSRFNSSSFVERRNKITSTRLFVNSNPPSAQVFSIFSNSITARLTFYSIGKALDLALLDNRVSELYNAIGAAI